ncbi:MAG: NAD-dependent epimerase/dehydratase family protein [Alphaproteobacteria bacterium]|nr:NAD-dependent epimerase/dehydratase family protein [Alphaproteobacteria bacterium]
MRILLTGGSGDLGTLLTQELQARGDDVANIDMAPPKLEGADFIQGSILDREAVKKAMQGADCVVHIAAWHGIHEQQGKTPADFHDLNVTGTFNVLQAAAEAGVKKFVFISSTSVDDPYSVYGHTKILGEEMCRAYAHRHGMEIITLRPRAFIPSWNRAVYEDYAQWANWFMKGAVHVDDVKQAVVKSIDRLQGDEPLPEPAPVLTVDGAYEYTHDDLNDWDAEGPGSTFKKHYAEDYELAVSSGLDPARKPKVLDISLTRDVIGYAPVFSLKSLLAELREYGLQGPPAPFADRKQQQPAQRKHAP